LALARADRESLDRHLACCSVCRQEYERVGAGHLGEKVRVDKKTDLLRPRPVRRNRPSLVPSAPRHLRWQRLALAASLAAALCSGGLLWDAVRNRPQIPFAEAMAKDTVLPLARYASSTGEQGGVGEVSTSLNGSLWIDGFESGTIDVWSEVMR
jgi:anti-sigma factor RsiW